MKDCKDISKLLPLYISNDLSEKETALVQTHLTHCPDCQKEITSYQSLRDTIGRWDVPQKPQVFWNDYWNEIDARLSSGERPVPKSYFRTLPVIRYAAVFLIGLTIGYLGYRFSERTKTDQLSFQPVPASITAAKTDDGNRILGARVRPVSRALSEQLGLPSGQGIVICDFSSGCPFREAGLEPADIILELNDRSIPDLTTFSDIVSQPADKLNLKIVRHGIILSIEINTKSLVIPSPEREGIGE